MTREELKEVFKEAIQELEQEKVVRHKSCGRYRCGWHAGCNTDDEEHTIVTFRFFDPVAREAEEKEAEKEKLKIKQKEESEKILKERFGDLI